MAKSSGRLISAPVTPKKLIYALTAIVVALVSAYAIYSFASGIPVTRGQDVVVARNAPIPGGAGLWQACANFRDTGKRGGGTNALFTFTGDAAKSASYSRVAGLDPRSTTLRKKCVNLNSNSGTYSLEISVSAGAIVYKNTTFTKLYVYTGGGTTLNAGQIKAWNNVNMGSGTHYVRIGFNNKQTSGKFAFGGVGLPQSSACHSNMDGAGLGGLCTGSVATSGSIGGQSAGTTNAGQTGLRSPYCFSLKSGNGYANFGVKALSGTIVLKGYNVSSDPCPGDSRAPARAADFDEDL